jgi:hypothetical protein
MQEGEGQGEQNDKAADDDAMDVDQQAEPQVGSFVLSSAQVKS